MAAEVVDAARAVAEIGRGDTVMVGGFGLVGAPLTLIEALVASAAARELTVISNNLGEPGKGLGALLLAGGVRKAIGSYFTSNPDVVAAHERGELEVELLPQGTLSESIRSGGAGLGGFYTPTAVGTQLADGREEREIDGARYLFYPSLRADVALVRARTADELGNLVYDKTARNFNPDMATAGRVVVAEVDEIVPVGGPGAGARRDAAPVRRLPGPRGADAVSVSETIARRVAGHLRDGETVNLGIGIPTLVADFIEDRPLVLHTENGMLGVGPTPEGAAVDVNLVNAGKLPVSETPGAAYFSSLGVLRDDPRRPRRRRRAGRAAGRRARPGRQLGGAGPADPRRRRRDGPAGRRAAGDRRHHARDQAGRAQARRDAARCR